MQIFGISDVGMKRSLNEDNFSADIYDGTAVALVCDGMGGANAGEVASRMACKLFVKDIVPKLRDIKASYIDGDDKSERIGSAISEACSAANAEVWKSSKSSPDLSGMGTTMSGCIIDGDTLWTFNVGDSRVYHFDGENIRQLTVDHSFVQTLINEGKITEEEALTHPNRNVILRALGVAERVECDVVHSSVEKGCYLICSDGLSNYFDRDEFVSVMSSERTLAEKAEALVSFANGSGGADNITVVLVDTENKKDGGSDEH